MVMKKGRKKEGKHLLELRESREFGGNRTSEWIGMQTPSKKRAMTLDKREWCEGKRR